MLSTEGLLKEDVCMTLWERGSNKNIEYPADHGGLNTSDNKPVKNNSNNIIGKHSKLYLFALQRIDLYFKNLAT